MWVLGPIGFTAPWLLLGLIALPVLWLLLRAVPPAPIGGGSRAWRFCWA